MKKWIGLAGTVALAACQQAEAPAPETTEEAAAAPMAIDGGPLAGTYNTVDAEGTAAVWTLADDGTFTLAAEGTDPVTGTYTNTSGDDGDTFCADPEGDDTPETCWAIGKPGDDGSWTATAADGSVLTVTRGKS